MNRRSALLIALAVAVAAFATLLLARRGRAINAATAPAPQPVAPPVLVPALRPVPAPQLEQGEQPLPTWARVAIVAGALLAFLAVSMIATKSG